MYKSLRAMVEPMMINHIMPEIEHQNPFMRMRALWVYGMYCEHFSFKDNSHLSRFVELCYKSLVYDKDMPVRLSAAVCLSKLLKNDDALNILKPHLKIVLESYLKLMSEIESEELVSSLEDIVALYKDDIGPFAI